MAFPISFGHENGQRLAFQLFFPIAEHLFRGAVDRKNISLGVGNHDCIIRGIDKGAEPLFGFPQGFDLMLQFAVQPFVFFQGSGKIGQD
ncbi:MAG: hypothetical protein ACD_74C00206G0001, partial [uncultured bacterium]